MTPDELAVLPYAQILMIRAQEYKDHVAAMENPAEIDAFVATMTTRFGPKVKVWQNVVEDWRIALLLAQWGEAVEHWPAIFGRQEIAYAQQWAAGRTPRGSVVVTYLN